MKSVCMIGGVLLLVCGILLALLCGSAEESLQPMEIRSGYYIGDQYVITDTRKIGGNPEAAESADALQSVGTVIAVAGGILFFASLFMKKPESVVY